MGLCTAEQVGCFEHEDDGRFAQALQEWFDKPGPKTGVFANNDLWALRTLRALRELRIDVPGQAGVIGFDNISMDRYLQPSLSSVSQPIAQMAAEAVDRLMYRIDHPEAPERLDRPLPATLVLREST